MGIFDRLHRSRSAVDLPKLALPPLHEPVRSLTHFTDAPLDPIPLGVGDGRDLVVGADGQELLAELVALADVDRVHAVGQAGLLEQDVDLVAVGRGPGIDVDGRLGHGLGFRRIEGGVGGRPA